MSAFSFSELAETDLQEIWDYIAADNEGAAVRLKEAILNACESLVANPTLGHFRRDLTRLNVRFSAVMKNYLVIYEPETQPLRIVRVLHAARVLKSILK